MEERLVIHHKKQTDPLENILNLSDFKDKKCLLVCVDKSENSAKAYEYAKKELYEENKYAIIVITVRESVDTTTIMEDKLNKSHTLVEEADKRKINKAKDVLLPYLKELRELKVPHYGYILKDDPRHAIIELSRMLKPTLVVIGSRGLGVMSRMFLGSVSDYIVNHCPSPVVVVRS